MTTFISTYYPIIQSNKLFLSVAKDLANRPTDMVLLYSEASYRIWDGFRLFDFLKNKSVYGFRLFFCPSNIEALDARGATARL